ncbi:MAG TPA: HIT domain-containing protein [Acidimicrobiales bacterium]|nr:HIT domain-containing protein [Acidimicrobiales bacterium]
MSLERLWAAWRSGYVSSVSEGSDSYESSDPATCVFCRLLEKGAEGADEFVVHRAELAAAVLNAYPYTSGHLLVMPIRHLRDLDELSDEEQVALWGMTRDAVTAIRRAYVPEGLNIGANFGRPAGAGIPDHLHLHALPRWVGDTSFMTSVAETRVLPEALSDSAKRLRAAWPQ